MQNFDENSIFTTFETYFVWKLYCYRSIVIDCCISTDWLGYLENRKIFQSQMKNWNQKSTQKSISLLNQKKNPISMIIFLYAHFCGYNILVEKCLLRWFKVSTRVKIFVFKVKNTILYRFSFWRCTCAMKNHNFTYSITKQNCKQNDSFITMLFVAFSNILQLKFTISFDLSIFCLIFRLNK